MTRTLSRLDIASYSSYALPLAMVALPVYVYVPQFYAETFGLSLTLIGAALLLARLLDAFIDPAIGMWLDRSRSANHYAHYILLALPLLLTGFLALFHPLTPAHEQPLIWFALSLMLVYGGYSLASIAYQSWGAALTQARGARTQLSASREASGLAGVILAAAIPGVLGLPVLLLLFVPSLLLGSWLLLRHAPRPVVHARPAQGNPLIPIHNPRFRWLLSVFVLNGIAAAIPATLFMFFSRDFLGLPQYAGLFLLLYFFAAALSMPLWTTLSKHYSEKHAWLLGMALAIISFVWAYFLQAGDVKGYALICIVSGMALGADLALPPALLAATIGHAQHAGIHEGTYFGLWNWATKLNLALAAGIALPMLELLGYHSGSNDAQGLQALAFGYAILPSILKTFAALLLWRAPLNLQ